MISSHTFRQRIGYSALGLVVLFAALVAGDYLVLHSRMALRGAGSVMGTVPTMYAALMKNGQYNIYYNQPKTTACVRTIFPWLGYEPCWYVERHPLDIVQ